MVDLIAPPTPPATEVPPTTTAQTTNNGTLSPAIELAELSCDASITPAKAAVTPQMRYDFEVAAYCVHGPAERRAPQDPIRDGHHGEHRDDQKGHRTEDL